MNYTIKRGEQEFGPYSLVELKQYMAEGRIISTDLAKSEGMEEWAPVTDVTGNIEHAGPLAGVAALQQGRAPAEFIPPPNLHWALVLVITMMTCGIFGLVWIFIQAAWAKRVDPTCNAIVMFALYIAAFVPYMLALLSEDQTYIALGAISYVACIVFYVVGIFSVRRAIHRYYEDAPFQLRLNGFLVFFFNVYYFQYHFNRINEWHRTGIFPR